MDLLKIRGHHVTFPFIEVKVQEVNMHKAKHPGLRDQVVIHT